MTRLLLALLLAASPALALRQRLDPGALASDCPVIVRGTIVSVDEPKETDGKKRPLATAAIEITEIVRNDFKDVPLKVGGTLRVKMVAMPKPAKEGEVRAESSRADIRYPAKTGGLWLVMLDDDDELRIDTHPEQRQPIDGKLRMVREAKAKKADDEFPNDEPGTVRGDVLKAEWHAERKKKAEGEAKEMEKERKKDEAEAKAARTLAAGLAAATRIDADSMADLLAAPPEHRGTLLRLEGKAQPLSADRLVAVLEYLYAHDPGPGDDSRTTVVCRLAHSDLKATPRAGEVLATALADKSAGVRSFACQSLWLHGDKARAPAIRPLLADQKQDVREGAVRALGMLGDTKAIPAIVKRYEKDQPDKERCWVYAECLAKLGEEEVSTAAAVKSMDSDNWNVRYFAVNALLDVKGEAAIPAAVACLGREVEWILAGGQNTGFDERIYKTAADLLAKRTGKKHGLDPVAWADWWDTARKQYDAPALTFDRDKAAKAYREQQKK